MVVGVSQGYKKELELVGVGYRAEAKGQNLEMSLGYSHDINILLPNEVKVETKTKRRSNPIITLTCIDKQLIGHVAAKIRSLRRRSLIRKERYQVCRRTAQKKGWKIC